MWVKLIRGILCVLCWRTPCGIYDADAHARSIDENLLFLAFHTNFKREGLRCRLILKENPFEISMPTAYGIQFVHEYHVIITFSGTCGGVLLWVF